MELSYVAPVIGCISLFHAIILHIKIAKHLKPGCEGGLYFGTWITNDDVLDSEGVRIRNINLPFMFVYMAALIFFTSK